MKEENKNLIKIVGAIKNFKKWKNFSLNNREEYIYVPNNDYAIEILPNDINRTTDYLNYMCYDKNPLWINIALKYKSNVIDVVEAQEYDGGRIVLCKPHERILLELDDKKTNKKRSYSYAYYDKLLIEIPLNILINKSRFTENVLNNSPLLDSLVILNSNRDFKIIEKIIGGSSREDIVKEIDKQDDIFIPNPSFMFNEEANRVYKCNCYVKKLLK